MMRVVNWVGGLLASGVLLYFAVSTDPAPQPTVADHLRYTSVHVLPDAERRLDVDRTRQVIGLRPIVVAVGSGVRCREIVDALPDVIAIVVRDAPADPVACAGADARYFDPGMATEAPDVIAAYVRDYDARAGGTPPRREPPVLTSAGPDARQVVTLAAAGLFAAMFVLTTVFAIRFVVRDQREHEDRIRNWCARGDARLNRLADRVLRFDRPMETAKRYALVLREFEAASTERERVAVDGRLTELEREVGVLPKREVRPRAPRRKPVARKRKTRWHGDVGDVRARRDSR